MSELIDEINYYASVIRTIENSDEPDKGCLDYFKSRLIDLRKQFKEALA